MHRTVRIGAEVDAEVRRKPASPGTSAPVVAFSRLSALDPLSMERSTVRVLTADCVPSSSSIFQQLDASGEHPLNRPNCSVENSSRAIYYSSARSLPERA
jgi:hypothetical protein